MRARRIKGVNGVGVYHCVSRIVGLERLLGTRERDCFVNLMWRVAEFCGVEVLSFCVMPDHFHLVVRVEDSKPLRDEELIRRFVCLYGESHKKSVELKRRLSGEETQGNGAQEDAPEIRSKLSSRMSDISFFMKELKMRFTAWYNRKSGRMGTLWTERYKSVLLEDNPQIIQLVCDYVDYNPVRAGEVSSVSDYAWCTQGACEAGDERAGVSMQKRREGAKGHEISDADGLKESPLKGIYKQRMPALSNGLFIGSMHFVAMMTATVVELPGWTRSRQAVNLIPGVEWRINWMAGRRSRKSGKRVNLDSS